MIGLLIFWSFMAYGMTTIIVYGSIFEGLRNWLNKHSKFFGELVNCPLCTSTWVGFFLSLTLGGISSQIFSIGYFGIFFTLSLILLPEPAAIIIAFILMIS